MGEFHLVSVKDAHGNQQSVEDDYTFELIPNKRLVFTFSGEYKPAPGLAPRHEQLSVEIEGRIKQADS